VTEEEDASHFAEPLLGFRVWTINRDALLRPIAVNCGAWMPGENRARCMVSDHEAPHPHCGCGFNALHRIPQGYAGDFGHAVGAIAAWGDVDLFRTGFRAEFATVIALGRPGNEAPGHRDRLERAARFYGVPLVALAELPHFAAEFARPVAPEHLPGTQPAARLRAGSQAWHAPLPKAALCSATAGNGVWLDKHVALAHKGRAVRLGPTPSLAAAAGAQVRPRVHCHEEVDAGDRLFSVGSESRLVCPSPLAGRVMKVRDAGEVDPGSGPAANGWIVELEARNESPDQWPIVWGIVGADAYRRLVLERAADARLIADVADGGYVRGPAATPGDWLRDFAGRMRAMIDADPALGDAIERLGLNVGFRLTDGDGMRVAPGVCVAGDPGDGVDVCLELEPEDFIRYWQGSLSLARDQVTIGSFRTGRFQRLAERPVHIAAGTPGQARLAMSIHRRMHRGAEEILAEIGIPWFRAGEAVRDPQRNRDALAGTLIGW
jgi:hypothetical protein